MLSFFLLKYSFIKTKCLTCKLLNKSIRHRPVGGDGDSVKPLKRWLMIHRVTQQNTELSEANNSLIFHKYKGSQRHLADSWLKNLPEKKRHKHRRVLICPKISESNNWNISLGNPGPQIYFVTQLAGRKIKNLFYRTKY